MAVERYIDFHVNRPIDRLCLFVTDTYQFLQGGGGRGGGRAQRQNWADLPRTNAKFEQFYNEQGFIPEEEKEDFWNALRRDLPNSFRFTGSRGYVIRKIFPAEI